MMAGNPRAAVSNEQIYDKLLEIERVINNRLTRKSFTDIEQWKKYIWDNCPHKKERMKDREIEFYCDILKGACEFADCPRNILDNTADK
jgi:hypothetical protein